MKNAKKMVCSYTVFCKLNGGEILKGKSTRLRSHTGIYSQYMNLKESKLKLFQAALLFKLLYILHRTLFAKTTPISNPPLQQLKKVFTMI